MTPLVPLEPSTSIGNSWEHDLTMAACDFRKVKKLFFQHIFSCTFLRYFQNLTRYLLLDILQQKKICEVLFHSEVIYPFKKQKQIHLDIATASD